MSGADRKPETRLERALFNARLRARPGKDRTLLTTESQDEMCFELLQLHQDVTRLEAQAEQHTGRIATLEHRIAHYERKHR